MTVVVKASVMVRYEVRTLACLGNADEGWEINDSCSAGYVDLDEDSLDDDDFIEALEAHGYGFPEDDVIVDDSGDGSLVGIARKMDGKPLLQLWRKKNPMEFSKRLPILASHSRVTHYSQSGKGSAFWKMVCSGENRHLLFVPVEVSLTPPEPFECPFCKLDAMETDGEKKA